jgi:hypothetical protein
MTYFILISPANTMISGENVPGPWRRADDRQERRGLAIEGVQLNRFPQDGR